MSERVLWLANDDGLTTQYQIWKSVDGIAPYVFIAFVPHNKTDFAIYLPATDQFFFDDLFGLDTDYYKVCATDGLNTSPFTEARQPDPPLPPRCKIHGKILNLDGTPIEGANGIEVLFHVKLSEKDKSGQFVGRLGVNENEVAVMADQDGDWEADLMQGAEVVIDIPAANLVKTFVVPADDTAELTDLI